MIILVNEENIPKINIDIEVKTLDLLITYLKLIKIKNKLPFKVNDNTFSFEGCV